MYHHGSIRAELRTRVESDNFLRSGLFEGLDPKPAFTERSDLDPVNLRVGLGPLFAYCILVKYNYKNKAESGSCSFECSDQNPINHQPSS